MPTVRVQWLGTLAAWAILSATARTVSTLQPKRPRPTSRRPGMAPGSLVVVLRDPLLYGAMIIRSTTTDGRLLIEAVTPDQDGSYLRGLLTPQEVEDLDRWVTHASVDMIARCEALTAA